MSLDVEAARDGERVTVLARDSSGTVGVLATVDAGASETDVLEALAEIDSELEIGLTVLGSERAGASDEEVLRAVADGGVDR